jgi:hypothetical protein
MSSTAIPYQRLLTVEILHLPALTTLLSGEYPATELLSTVNSTIAPSLFSSPCRARLTCQSSAVWVPDWRPFHPILLFLSSQADFQLAAELFHSPTSYFSSLPFPSLHCTQLNCSGLMSSLYSLRADPKRNTRSHCNYCCVHLVSVGTCLPSRCLETSCITPLFYCCGNYLTTAAVYSHHLAVGLYATLFI